MGRTLGAHTLEGGAPVEHSRQSSLWVLGPQPTAVGCYRCFGTFTRSPYSWSDSSDPLFLSVTGSTTSTFPSTMDPHTTEEAWLPQGHSSQLHLLLRLSVAFIYTSIFLVFLSVTDYPQS
ncbi:hypothetical protein CapIbe_024060 [Capra ibex]